MVVRPEARGGGAGPQLLRAALEFARSAGCLRVTLLTDADNAAAQRFYARHGFGRSAMIPMRLHLGDLGMNSPEDGSRGDATPGRRVDPAGTTK